MGVGSQRIDFGDSCDIGRNMIDIKLLTIAVIAEQTRSTHHIDFVIHDKELLRTFKLQIKSFLVVEQVKAAEVVPSKEQQLLFI